MSGERILNGSDTVTLRTHDNVYENDGEKFSVKLCSVDCLLAQRKGRFSRSGLFLGSCRIFPATGHAVVHRELDWMRRSLETLDFLHPKIDIAVDLRVGENIAALQEIAVSVEKFHGLAQ